MCTCSRAMIISQLMSSPSSHYCTLSAADTARDLKTDLQQGLAFSEILPRRELQGPNELRPDAKESLIHRFIDQLRQPLILLLFGSAFVSALVGHYEDAISITLVRTS